MQNLLKISPSRSCREDAARQAGRPLMSSVEVCFPLAAASALGRNDSPSSGSFREANLQRRLSGGESEELSVATRPKPGIRTSPKPPLRHGALL